MAESTTNKAASTAKATAAKAQSTAKETAAKAQTTAKETAAKAQTTAKATAKKANDATPRSAKDAVNTVVGFGVMGVNKVQAGARDLMKSVKADELGSRITKAVDQATESAKSTGKQADERIEAAITKAENAFVPYEEKLPAQVRDLSRKTRETGAKVREQVRTKVLA